MIRDSIKGFIDKEMRPHIDELEDGDLPPYEITRKMFAAFGIDAMAPTIQPGSAEPQRRGIAAFTEFCSVSMNALAFLLCTKVATASYMAC
jgi:hypothetical protein